MKKIYIEPSVKAVVIKLPTILAGSIPDSGDTGTSVNPNDPPVTDPNDMDSFGADFE